MKFSKKKTVLFGIAVLATCSISVQNAFAVNEWAYTVRPGDTLSQVVERELGMSWYRTNIENQIRYLNPGINVDRIYPGQRILFPEGRIRERRRLERERQERERREREAREKAAKAAREKVEREAHEAAAKAAQEKAEREVREKAAKAAQEKAEREKLEQAKSEAKVRVEAEERSRIETEEKRKQDIMRLTMSLSRNYVVKMRSKTTESSEQKETQEVLKEVEHV